LAKFNWRRDKRDPGCRTHHGSRREAITVDHPVRTLLYEFFVEPFWQLLRRRFAANVYSPAEKIAAKKAA
jgi:hypothetical protein